MDVFFSIGKPEGNGWIPATEAALVFLVGLTGTGKSSTLEALNASLPGIRNLPDRRELTQKLIIDPMMAAEGRQAQELPRIERYPYLRKFRESCPGGMPEALAKTWIKENSGQTLVFDNIRGKNEAEFAALHFPKACFISFYTPEAERLWRLAGRKDPHDVVSKTVNGMLQDHKKQFAEYVSERAAGCFGQSDIDEIAKLLAENPGQRAELIQKIDILLEESSLYGQKETLEALRKNASGKTLFMDTSLLSIAEASKKTLEYIKVHQQNTSSYA